MKAPKLVAVFAQEASLTVGVRRYCACPLGIEGRFPFRAVLARITAARPRMNLG